MKRKISIIFITTMMLASIASVAQAEMKYTLLESFPGFFTAGAEGPELPAMILAVYKFGIWTVGIAGLFMLVIGGFWYMTSAGNNATAETAKKIIWDSLLGIVAALAAYLIMYVINPDLTKINIAFTAAKITTEGTPMGPIAANGNLIPLSSGVCSASNLVSAFGVAATMASGICNRESKGTNIPSTIDICKGQNKSDPVSVGLFQINLSAHKVAGLNCPGAFNTPYTAAIAKDKTKCWVTDRALYDNCVNKAMDSSINIATAKSIYNNAGNRFTAWGR